MPAILPVYDPGNKAINELFDKEMKARGEELAALWKWRDGDHPAVLMIEPNERDDNTLLNLCGQIVEDVTDFMGMPQISVAGGIESQEEGGELVSEKSPAQEALELITLEDKFEDLFFDSVESGLVGGHIFLRIVPAGEGEPPMLALLDPATICAAWDMTRAGMRDSTLFYRMAWKMGNITRQQDIVPDWLLPVDHPQKANAEIWHIFEYEKKSMSTTFEPAGYDVWGYSFAPIVDFKIERRPHKYYGASLLRGITRLNDALNFVATNTGRILKHHAHPKSFVFGAKLDEMDEIGGIYHDLPEEARIENLEMQSDLASSLAYFEKLNSLFFSLKRVVDLASVRDKVGQLTNFGVQVLFASMIKMLQSRQKLIGAGYQEALWRCLWIMGHDVEVVVRWGYPLPVNRLELITELEKESDLGITSKQTIAAEMERDFVQERENMQEEKATNLDNAVSLIERTQRNGVMF